MTSRSIVMPAVAGVLTAGFTWVMGVVTVDAILMGALAALLVATPRLLGYPADRGWPGDPDGDGRRGFYEVRRLASIFRRGSGGDAFGRLTVPRLRELAERRLSAAGMSMDDAAVRETLGAEVFDWLDGRPSPLDSRSRVGQAEQVLDRLAEYDEEGGRV